jgi:prepilin-type N-terminal cleavage/methylation domain-containing protein
MKRNKGFSLLEMLVTVAIIALLSGIVMTSLTGSKAKSRDATRISGMGQLQLALELFFDKCQRYPNASSGAISTSDSCTVNGNSYTILNFISKIPPVPAGITGQTKFDYNINSDNSDYFLHIQIEKTSDALQNSISLPSWYSAGSVSCDTTIHYCLGPK